MTTISALMTFVLTLFSLDQSTESAQIVESYGKPFDVYWNVPTFQCRSKKVYFEELLTRYGIMVNKNDSFKGDKMTIMYDPGNFPAILDNTYNSYVTLRNGGVPQAGNLADHLEKFNEHVQHDIPNADYNGLAVIDFESWRPIYRQNWGSLLPYRELSVDIERQMHPTWSASKWKREAELRFETEGRKYVEDTLKLAKLMRPNATWGYYAYPYCYNMQSPDYSSNCSETVTADNDRLSWMFNESDSLHPSLYFPESFTKEQRVQLMNGRLYESVRVKEAFEGNKKIYPYFWYLYNDTNQFLDEQDFINAINLFHYYGTDGMIIWGSSNDVNTKKKCELLYNYVEFVLGPLILKTKTNF